MAACEENFSVDTGGSSKVGINSELFNKLRKRVSVCIVCLQLALAKQFSICLLYSYFGILGQVKLHLHII